MRDGCLVDERFGRYLHEVENGGRAVGGPLLVIYGETDLQVSIKGTVDAVEETGRLFPGSQLEFVRLPGVSHVPAMTATQRVWMDWIADRFAGWEVGRGLRLGR